MAAHLRNIVPALCQEPRCTKLAQRELRDTYNTLLGVYCITHATTMLREQLEREAAGYERPRDNAVRGTL